MNPRIEKIEVDDVEDVAFYFAGSSEPFSSREFVEGSSTRSQLEWIERAIRQYNLGGGL